MDLVGTLKITRHNTVPPVTHPTTPFYTEAIYSSSIQVGEEGGGYGITIQEYDNTNTLKKIQVNSTEFTNGTYTLPFTTMYENIYAVDACVYPPPNPTTVKVVDNILVYDNADVGLATSQAQLTSGNITIQDINGSGTRQSGLDAGSLSISDGTSLTTYIDAGDATFTSTGSGEFVTMTPTYVQVNNPGTSVLTQVNSSSIQLVDGATNIQAELSNDINTYSEPFLRLRNQNGSDNYLRFSELNIDPHINFAFNANQSFFKQMNPFSFTTVSLPDGSFIDKNMAFVLADGITTLKLHPPGDYLDTANGDGWSCIVSNLNGSSVNIDTAGYQWYAHSNGLNGNPIDLSKWSTCRLTLIYSSNTVGDYVWALSQF
jgi:hypothetical protein